MTRTVNGIIWMVVAGFLFVGVTGVVRHLGSDMSAIQSAFMRYAFGTLLFLPVYLRLIRTRTLPGRLGLYVLRGIVHGGGVMLWFYAMARIPIADVTALAFTAPIFTTIGAAIFLGERLHARRIAAVAAGFVGTLIILRPGLEAIELGALAQLVAAPLFACSFIVAKKLTDTESSVAIVAYLSVFTTIILAPAAFVVWRPPTLEEAAWLFGVALLATAGHFCLNRAFRSAELGLLQPFQFPQLVWASLLGLYLFDERPDAWTWVGAAVIVGSATYIAHRERRS